MSTGPIWTLYFLKEILLLPLGIRLVCFCCCCCFFSFWTLVYSICTVFDKQDVNVISLHLISTLHHQNIGLFWLTGLILIDRNIFQYGSNVLYHILNHQFQLELDHEKKSVVVSFIKKACVHAVNRPYVSNTMFYVIHSETKGTLNCFKNRFHWSYKTWFTEAKSICEPQKISWYSFDMMNSQSLFQTIPIVWKW